MEAVNEIINIKMSDERQNQEINELKNKCEGLVKEMEEIKE